MQVRGISFFHRTERTSTVFSAFASFQNDYQNEHTTNIAEQERTENEQRKQHIYGVWTALFGCSARIGIHPCTYAHTCATLLCTAFSGNSSGNLSAQTRRSQIGSQCESYRHPSQLPSPWKSRRQRFFIAWVTVVTVKLHRVGYRHPCHFEQLLTASVPHKLCKLAAF